jgi:Leu/Phe-tRNA-protein transferase
MWSVDQCGTREYARGQEDWAGAAALAADCSLFRPDVEEEWVADEVRSCYNCRYRRWTAHSFNCLMIDGA